METKERQSTYALLKRSAHTARYHIVRLGNTDSQLDRQIGSYKRIRTIPVDVQEYVSPRAALRMDERSLLVVSTTVCTTSLSTNPYAQNGG
jgi:hypothetical protein